MAGNTSRPGAGVAARVFAVLDTFDAEHTRQRLTGVARRAGIPVPTAHRLIGELVTWGALTRQPDGCYTVGRRLWDLGLLAPAHTGLREVASPFLHDIYGATLATVHLAVRSSASRPTPSCSPGCCAPSSPACAARGMHRPARR